MGPSGCGKSVLLRLVNGYLQPTEGHVFLEDGARKRSDLSKDQAQVRDLVGYVPQEDIMFPELTVRQSLNCRQRLCLPDRVRSFRGRAIQSTLERLGFEKSRIGELLNTPIGSAESGIKGLSGGERKRINIAHELISKPLVLLLDEPTSGLSSFDADRIVELLSDLAQRQKLTIIMTIHQPSREAFDRFNNVLLMARGGRVAYYGPARTAADYFERTTRVQCKVAPAEYLLAQVSEDTRANATVANFARDRASLANVPQPLPAGTPPPLPQPRPKVPLWRRAPAAIHQWAVLLARNLQVLRRDKFNLSLLFSQAPVIALLMLLGFAGFTSDSRQQDVFANRVYRFHKLVDGHPKPVPVDKLWRQAGEEARADQQTIGQLAAQYRAAVYFILVAASLWFGMVGGCKEVVTERHILARERRSSVNFLPYLSAKVASQTLVLGLQTGLLVALTACPLLGLSSDSAVLLWALLWGTSVVGACLGLLVSCVAQSFRFALTAVPLLLLPQLLFGGLLRPHVNLVSGGGVLAEAASVVTPQRWAFEAALAVDSYAERGVLKQLPPVETDHVMDDLRIVSFADTQLGALFFGSGGKAPLQSSVFWLLMQGVALFVLSYLCLHWQAWRRKL